RVAEDLPVAVVHRTERVAFGHCVEWIAFEGSDHRAEIGPQALAGLAREVHEDEPCPGLAMHRGEAEPILSELEELAFLVNVGARPVEAVPPAMVLAHELPGAPAGLLAGRAVPQQLVPAVPADVVESPHATVHVA